MRNANQNSVNGKVLEMTYDYEKFNFIPFNRPTVPSHIKNLANSMNDIGFIGNVVVTRDMYVIDGQNRIKAAQLSGSPVYYVQENFDYKKNEKMVNLIVKLQQGKNWSLEDYLHAWMSFNKDTYMYINKIRTEYMLNVTHVLLLAGEYSKGFRNGARKFKDGVLIFNQNCKDEIQNLAGQFYEIFTFNPNWLNFKGQSNLKRVIVNMVRTEGYSQARMLHQLKKDSYLLEATRKGVYIDQLEKIYNGTSTVNYLEFLRY